MNRISRPLKAEFDLCIEVSDSLPDVNAQYCIECLTKSSPNFAMFWNNADKAWTYTRTWNDMDRLALDYKIHTASVLSSDLSSAAASYLVQYKLGLSQTNVKASESEIWECGLGASQEVRDLHDYVMCSKRTLTRLSGDMSIEESIFDASGTERFRFISNQDTSGNQPEETRLNITGTIQ